MGCLLWENWLCYNGTALYQFCTEPLIWCFVAMCEEGHNSYLICPNQGEERAGYTRGEQSFTESDSNLHLLWSSTTQTTVGMLIVHDLRYSSCHSIHAYPFYINSLRPRQNRHHFVDSVFKCNFFNENVWIAIKISLKFVPKSPINNIPALVQILAWRLTGDKPLSEPMMTQFNDVTGPQWVKVLSVSHSLGLAEPGYVEHQLSKHLCLVG